MNQTTASTSAPPRGPVAGPRRLRSKTVATWIAVVGGSLGLHRFYLHGPRDVVGWLHPLPTIVGLVGAFRMRNLGQDDMLSWALIPLLGLALTAGFLAAIVIGLTPDATWARRFGRRQDEPADAVLDADDLAPDERTAWGPVLGAIIALMVGGAVLMGTIAFSGQKFFEYHDRTVEDSPPPTR
jgi:hypothetical protein